MKTNRIIYWIATTLICALMLFSAGFYLSDLTAMKTNFVGLGFPGWIPLPLAILKIGGVAMILLRKSRWLTEWAYAGFFFDAMLAGGAHFDKGEDYTMILIFMALTLVSYFFGKTVRPM